MMHGHEKSDPAIVAMKPANKAGFPLRSSLRRNQPLRSRWSKGRGPRGMRLGKARTGLSAGLACHRRCTACGKPLPFGPEVGAVCGKAARTDLCGGRSAMSVPTATARQSGCDPAGASPAQVRSSVRLVASVAWPLATVAAKRTQRLHGVEMPSNREFTCRRTLS